MYVNNYRKVPGISTCVVPCSKRGETVLLSLFGECLVLLQDTAGEFHIGDLILKIGGFYEKTAFYISAL